VFDDSLMVFKIKVAVNWNLNLFLILSCKGPYVIIPKYFVQ